MNDAARRHPPWCDHQLQVAPNLQRQQTRRRRLDQPVIVERTCRARGNVEWLECDAEIVGEEPQVNFLVDCPGKDQNAIGADPHLLRAPFRGGHSGLAQPAAQAIEFGTGMTAFRPCRRYPIARRTQFRRSPASSRSLAQPEFHDPPAKKLMQLERAGEFFPLE